MNKKFVCWSYFFKTNSLFLICDSNTVYWSIKKNYWVFIGGIRDHGPGSDCSMTHMTHLFFVLNILLSLHITHIMHTYTCWRLQLFLGLCESHNSYGLDDWQQLVCGMGLKSIVFFLDVTTARFWKMCLIALHVVHVVEYVWETYLHWGYAVMLSENSLVLSVNIRIYMEPEDWQNGSKLVVFGDVKARFQPYMAVLL